MAGVPTRHLCPRSNTFIDSFNTSVSKFSHTTRLRLLMYSYHGLPLKLSFCAANGSTTNSASTIQQIPQNRLNLYRETRCKPMGLADESFISNGQASGLSFLRTSVSIYQQNPPKRSNFYRGTKSKAMGLSGESDVSKGHACSLNSSRNSWLDKWSETQKNKLKAPQSVVDYRNNGEVSDSDSDHQESSSTGITMERIVQKLNRFQNVENSGEKEGNADKVFEKGSIEDIFHIDEGILPDSRGGFSEKRPFGDGNMLSINGEVRFPWQKPELNAEEERYSARKKIRTSLAELTLPETELYRLTKLTFKIKNKLKISGAGVSQDIVEKIHDRWKESEVVRLKIEAAPSLNMKRMHEVLEKKTCGLVIWRSGTSVGLYRGVGYKVQSEIPPRRTYNKDDIPHRFSITTTTTDTNVNDELETQVKPGIDDSNEVTEIESNPEMKFEEEIEKLLVGLGPRYIDWPGPDPLPIDADLLPGVLPGYEPPFRILPYGVRSSLGSKEATDLKRLARVIPPHFALGRSRQHQGLASAMIKLWEKSSIAKIALKRGVQLSTSEKMAEEIKKLTGCIMLSRNKDFLVFYRGKDFLSTEVAEALLEKGRLAKSLQDEEEQARLRTSAFVAKGMLYSDESRTAGTLGETLDAGVRWGNKLDKEKVTRDAKILRHGNLVKMLEKKLATVERKILKAERALSKVEQSLNPAKSVSNPDCITEEERFMFRKLGLRMKAFLLLGRRGVFSGTIENMHLHWKYRELVKIIVKAKNFDQVKRIALSLEAESGGVLVSVDKISKGYAIIVYRGNEYTRPSALRPRNLLTKRQALARSIELQRHEALMKHISTLQARYDRMRFELEQMAKVEDHGDEELYNKIDSNYHTEDEESEEEEDDAYPEIDGIDDDFLDQIEEEEVNGISLSL